MVLQILIIKMFFKAQIIQFHQIMLLLAGVEGISADSLIKSLLKVAVLVRGKFYWILLINYVNRYGC